MKATAQLSRLFFPSDFSNESEIAFQHALKLAMQCQASLQMMHVDVSDRADFDDFPSVRKTLERWGIIPDGCSHEDFEHLALDISKVISDSDDPVKACLNFLNVNETDLIVLSVHQRDGMMRWLGKMTGQRISYGSKQRTLFIPAGRPGFVNSETGDVRLNSILIPVVKKPRPEASVDFVQQLISSLDLVAGSITLLHVGSPQTMPFVKYPVSDAWKWSRICIEGEPTDTIVQFADMVEADLIVMTADGPDRFLDGLRGTTSERVLRKAHCPVAVIPVEPVAE